MEESARIEKLDNHKYRIYLKWDGTEKMLKGLLEDGFSVFNDKGVYYTDYEDEHRLFNFGMSMCECFNKLINNHLFTADYILHCSRQTPDANLIKEVEEKIPPYNIVKTMVDCFGMEAFLRLFALNYDSLVEEATQRYQNLDEVSFMGWLKENIEPRFTTQVLPEIYSRYLDVNRIGTNLSGLYCGYWAAWQDVRDNWEGFLDWVNDVEFTSEVDFEIFESLINHKDNIKKQFYTVYFYGYEGFTNILFGMLNDPNVLFKVKGLIQDVLKGCAQNDSEFAETIQMLYSKYKSIADGIDINFVPNRYENPSFVFPLDDVKKHLDEDIADDDETGYIGVIHNTRNDPEKLAEVFRFLVENRYVTPDEIDTTIYRFTGKRKPQADALLETVEWKGKINDALFICKEFYSGCYDKMLIFFKMDIEDQVRKNYSGYANRPTKGIQDLFEYHYYRKKSE